MFSRVKVFGEVAYSQFLLKRPDYCHECLAKMSVKCAWCGKPILVDDPITLYTPRKKDFKVPEYAVVYRKDPLQLVGCLRFSCADSGIDRSGFWIKPGRVYRVASPMEMALASDDVVICNDIGDISASIPFPDQD